MTQTTDAGQDAASDGTRLAELLAVLSLASDLGLGAPLERGLRTALAAMRIAELVGVTGDELNDLYHALFLIMIGCTSSSGTEAGLFGDEFAAGRGLSPLAMGAQQQMLGWIVRNAGAGEPPLQRAGRLVRIVTTAPGQMAESQAGHCEVAQRMAERLGLGSGVVALLGAVFERWDGHGQPGRLRGEQVPLGIRIGQIAYDLVVQELQGLGRDDVLARLRAHARKGLDPQLVGLVQSRAGEVFEATGVSSAWEAVLAAEPRPWRHAGEQGVESAALVIADFSDLKSAYLRGHSRGVASLAAAAAGDLGLDPAAAGQVRLAGWVHDLGRVTVSAGVWDRPGPLTEGEWESVRLHAHWTERVLGRVAPLAAAGRLAGLHHERLDGSGYHRGFAAASLPMPARVLAAADVCQAVSEQRPHRPALSRDAAERALAGEVTAGRLDGDAVAAVAAAAGLAATAKADPPGGLTGRELQVLRLVARGLATKEVARRLGVSVKTADHHIQRVYDKTGVRTRAGVTLFAIERGLLV